MPCLLARHSTAQHRHSTAPTREYYAVIQRAQCWWATTWGCRDEESNPGPPGSEKSTLPLGHCPSPLMHTVSHPQPTNWYQFTLLGEQGQKSVRSLSRAISQKYQYVSLIRSYMLVYCLTLQLPVGSKWPQIIFHRVPCMNDAYLNYDILWHFSISHWLPKPHKIYLLLFTRWR